MCCPLIWNQERSLRISLYCAPVTISISRMNFNWNATRLPGFWKDSTNSSQVFSNTRHEVWKFQNKDWDSKGISINIRNVDLYMYVLISLHISDIQPYAVWRKHSDKVIVGRCIDWFFRSNCAQRSLLVNNMLSWCSQYLSLKVSLLLLNSFYWHGVCEIVCTSKIDFFLLHSNLVTCHCHFFEKTVMSIKRNCTENHGMCF